MCVRVFVRAQRCALCVYAHRGVRMFVRVCARVFSRVFLHTCVCVCVARVCALICAFSRMCFFCVLLVVYICVCLFNVCCFVVNSCFIFVLFRINMCVGNLVDYKRQQGYAAAEQHKAEPGRSS